MTDSTEYKIGDKEAFQRIAADRALFHRMCTYAADLLHVLRTSRSVVDNAAVWNEYFEQMNAAVSTAWPRARDEYEKYSSFSVTRLTALFFETQLHHSADKARFFMAVPTARRRYLPKKYHDAAKKYPGALATGAADREQYQLSIEAQFKESTMGERACSTPAVRVRTEIFGRDVKDYTDDEVMSLVQGLEAKIAKYAAMTTKPKRITATIAQLKKDLADVVAAFDAA